MSGFTPYKIGGSDGTGWTPYRLGAAAAATTFPGNPPAYGMAYDLATGQWESSDQFSQFARDAARLSQEQALLDAQNGIPAGLRERELEIATNFQNHGYAMANDEFVNAREGNDGIMGFFDDVMTGVNQVKSKLGTTVNMLASSPEQAVRAIPIVGSYLSAAMDDGEESPADYDTYRRALGPLTEEEFSSFDEDTRKFLVARARGQKHTASTLNLPGVKQTVTGLTAVYHGTTTPLLMAREARAGSGVSGLMPFDPRNGVAMGRQFFDRDEWSEAWREAHDTSLGAAALGAMLSPTVSEDKLDEWGKHNSLFQLSAVGAEFMIGWYADPGVIAGRALGNAARVKRNELPLNENSATYKATIQNLRREEITVRNPITRKYADWRAERIRDGQAGVEAYAQAVPFDEFARLPMFRGRTAGGFAAAKMLHIAANNKDFPELQELSWQAFYADPKALATIQKMKEDPTELAKWGPGARSFIDAHEALKTKASVLESELEDLTRKGLSGSRFHRWEVDTDITVKEQQLEDAYLTLAQYQDYADWQELVGTVASDDVQILGAQVRAPRAPKGGWNSVSERRNTGKRRFFMDNQFGYSHRIVAHTAAAWTKKGGRVSIHDLDSGRRMVENQADTLTRLLDYTDVDREAVLTRFSTAKTNMERYQALYDFEEEHIVPALAGKLGVDVDVVRAVYNKVNDERNQIRRGIMTGAGRIYSSAPNIFQRMEDQASSVKLIDRSEDGELVTLRLMDGTDVTEVTMPASALDVRERPVDITQTPNYYEPVDVREIYLEMKRHRDILAEVDAGTLRRGGAQAAALIDVIGTKFYALWKPAQLWRLGWPQRVLMDEGLRALAVMGPMYWLTGPGAEAAAKSVSNIPHHIKAKYDVKRKGQVDLGAGPLTRRQKRHPEPAMRAEETSHAPQVPARLFPKLNPDRHARLAQMAETFDGSDPALTGAANGWFDAFARSQREEGATFIDPLNPKRPVRKGYFVPLDDLGLDMGDVSDVTARRNFLWWMGQNAELLARRGVRLRVEGGRVTPGVWFDSRHRRRADEMLQHVDATRRPDSDRPTMRDITRDLDVFIEDADVLSEVGEYLQRLLVAREQGGEMPEPPEGLADLLDARDHKEFRNLLEDLLDPRTDAQARLVETRATMELRAQQAASEASRGDRLSDDLERTETEAVERIASAFDEVDFEMDSPIEALLRHFTKRRQAGAGYVQMKSSDGRSYTVRRAFEGAEGELHRALTSSDRTFDVLSEGHGGALSMFRRQAAGHKTYHPPVFDEKALKKGTKENKKAIAYFQQWADMVNGQIAHSPIWSKMLNGWSDEKIVAWLNGTPEGASLRREMLYDGQSVELYVNEHRAKLDYYLPSGKLQRLLAKGRLKPSDLRKNVHNDDLPDVFGPDVELLEGNFLARMADTLWKSLGTIPIDALSRHPFAAAVYQNKMRSLVESTDSKWLDNGTIARYERLAHQYALEQTRRTLFDLTDQTSMTDALRFIAPFWGAQEEAIVKWARIVSDRPETVAHFFNAQTAVYNNFVVIDEDGNEVETNVREGGMFKEIGGVFYHPEDRIILQVPEFMRHTPFGKSLATIGAVGIPLGSANTVLQGEMPLAPGAGPFVTIPVDKFLRAYSDNYGTANDENVAYRWLFPIGRPSGGAKGIMEQLFPGYAKRAMSAMGPEGDMAKANLHWQVGREMIAEARRTGKPIPTDAQIAKQANWLWGLRMVTSFVSPVQTEYRGHNQFWADEAHRYSREYGADWFDKFMQDYGKEASLYAVSSSTSTVGVPPTSQGMEEWAENKRLIQQFSEWGGAIVSPAAFDDEFSYDAYKAGFDITLGPGDSRNIRELRDPEARFAEAEKRVGWMEFRKFQSAIDAELAARGLTNIQQADARDLLMAKTMFIEDLTQQQPAWREDYDNFASDIYARVAELGQWAFREEFDNRPDVLGARQYLVLREQVTAELDRAYAAGGSRSLQSQDNGALRQWFYEQVGALIQENPAFGEFYSRYLDGDTLTEGSGGYGVPTPR